MVGVFQMLWMMCKYWILKSYLHSESMSEYFQFDSLFWPVCSWGINMDIYYLYKRIWHNWRYVQWMVWLAALQKSTKNLIISSRWEKPEHVEVEHGTESSRVSWQLKMCIPWVGITWQNQELTLDRQEELSVTYAQRYYTKYCIQCIFYRVKIWMFYNVQTTNFTFVCKKNEIFIR